MYERCRAAYRVKGKGQRARGSTYETGIHIYSFNGRIFFCIMQSARGAPIASTSSDISGVISLAKGRKGNSEGREREKARHSWPPVSRKNGMTARKSRRTPDLQETTLLKRCIIVIVTRSYGRRRIVKILNGEEFWTGSKPAREFRKFKLHGHTRKELAGINHHQLK